MPITPPAPRHIVEKSISSVRVTLPSKKSIIHILWFCLWLFGWGYMVYGFLYFAGMMYQAVELGKTATPEIQMGSGFIIFGGFFLIIFLVLLAMGAVAIYAFLWLIAGKEVIEAETKVLKVSRQIFAWKRTREYSASAIKDLRPTTKESGFAPTRSIQKLLGLNGVIAFDYGAKTFRFGLEVDEAEAKQIIVAIKEGLAQQNAG
jgi:hypothetical protein